MEMIPLPFISNIRKMNNIDRLSLVMKHRKYSITEHCFHTAMLFQKFCIEMNVEYTLNDLNLILLHDILETKTSDLPYIVKNFNEKTRAAWDMIEKEIVNYCCLQENHTSLFYYYDETICRILGEEKYRIFKLCDLLELFEFIDEEISLGNKTKDIIEIYGRCICIIRDLCSQNEQKLKPVKDYLEHIIRRRGE